MHINSATSSYLNSTTFGATISERAALKKQKQIEKAQKFEEHEKYAAIANDCLNDVGQQNVKGFDRVKNIKNTRTGFNSSIYVNNEKNEVVIAYRCTDNKGGVYSDIQMVQGKIPDQLEDALKVYAYAKKISPNSDFTVVGHSLGGSLAQLVAAVDKDVKAVTFDSFGTKQIMKKYKLQDNNNCENYTRKGSIVSSTTQHPGTTRTIKKSPQDKDIYKKGFKPIQNGVVQKHAMDNYGNLGKSKYANEFMQNLKRKMISSQFIRNRINDLLKMFPGMKEKIANFFFEDDKSVVYA